MPALPEELRVHVLNVGDGDDIIIEFPMSGGKRKYAVVDCYDAKKTLDYLTKLGADALEFVCATHPHYDHIKGMPALLQAFKGKIRYFWDSGFRHTSLTWEKIVELVTQDTGITYMRVTSGMEVGVNGVKIAVLAPSISLRNRYDTYGVDINNASVVLKLEYKTPQYLKPSIIILGGDAQLDSWSRVLDEFPNFVKTENPDQKIKVTKSFNPLSCQVLKVSHHGSKHGTALECAERMGPDRAIVSCSGSSTYGFPHEIALLSLKDTNAVLYFTDYSTPSASKSGTTVVVSYGSEQPTITSLGEDKGAMASPP